MSLDFQNLDQAIALLKNAVKYSTLDGVKHLDFSLCVAHERTDYQRALMFCKNEVEKGILTEDELKKRLGLIK